MTVKVPGPSDGIAGAATKSGGRREGGREGVQQHCKCKGEKKE